MHTTLVGFESRVFVNHHPSLNKPHYILVNLRNPSESGALNMSEALAGTEIRDHEKDASNTPFLTERKFSFIKIIFQLISITKAE